MPPETVSLLKDWGFPAALSLYLLWRIDRTVFPSLRAYLEAMNKLVERFDHLAQTVGTIATNLTHQANFLAEGRDAALQDHVDIHDTLKAQGETQREQGEAIERIEGNTVELLKRIPAAKANKEA